MNARYTVTRNGHTVANAVREQADVLAQHEAEQHPRSVVRVVDAATGEQVAWWTGARPLVRAELAEAGQLARPALATADRGVTVYIGYGQTLRRVGSAYLIDGAYTEAMGA